MILSEKKAIGFLRPWWEVVYIHCLGLQIAICSGVPHFRAPSENMTVEFSFQVQSSSSPRFPTTTFSWERSQRLPKKTRPLTTGIAPTTPTRPGRSSLSRAAGTSSSGPTSRESPSPTVPSTRYFSCSPSWHQVVSVWHIRCTPGSRQADSPTARVL